MFQKNNGYCIFVGLLLSASSSFAQHSPVIDLTYAYGEDTIYWPTSEPFEKRTISEGHTAGGFYYSAYWFATAEHGGTHLDAPIHFYENGATADAIALERLIGDAVCIDVKSDINGNHDALISLAAIHQWEKEHARIPQHSIILLRTGWGEFWPDAEQYLGTARRGAEAIAELHFPGLSPEAAKWLIEERDIAAIGIDTASIDRGQSTQYITHQILAKAGVPVFENVANLKALPARSFKVIALPIKLKGGSGGPLRIVAILDEE